MMQKITGTVQTLPQQVKGTIKPTVASSGEEYQKGYEDGKNSVIDFARYANKIEFLSSDWAKEETTLTLERANKLEYLWYGFIDKTVKHLIVNCSMPITSLLRAFYLTAEDNNTGKNSIEHITLNADTSLCTTYQQTFVNMSNLKIIDGTPLNLSSSTASYMFSKVENLEEVRFAKNSIKQNFSIPLGKLSDETVQSIIDGLADLTGQTEQTLTVHKTVGEKLTEEQKATITAKNWILVY